MNNIARIILELKDEININITIYPATTVCMEKKLGEG